MYENIYALHNAVLDSAPSYECELNAITNDSQQIDTAAKSGFNFDLFTYK